MWNQVFLVAACFLFVTSVFSAEEEIKPLAIGSLAPDFDLPGVDDQSHQLAEYSDAPVLVIIFTCNHCPTAQAYEGRIKKLVTDYKEKGVAIVAISPNHPEALRLNEMGYTDVGDSLEECRIRAEDHEFNFPYLYDGETQETSKKYGPRATPHIFIFDKERKLQYEGGFDDSDNPERVKKHYVRDALDALLAGKPIPENNTPTRGCSIKWAAKRESVKEWMTQVRAEPVTLEKTDAPTFAQLLKNNSDKLLMVNFFATWCGPCQIEFPELVTIFRMYRHRKFDFVTLSVDDLTEGPGVERDVLAFLQDQESSSRNFVVADGNLDAFVEATGRVWMGGIPMTLLIRPGGEIVYKQLGMIDSLELRRKIVELLQEEQK
ncbi:MAG TPA: redoxin domain-containing protein [bacterium]|nr:redoxin domain-containing protein [bacterium]